MRGREKVSPEISERCAAVFRSLRARLDWTLAQCATAMQLSPQSADAGLARLEQNQVPWRDEHVQRLADLCATCLQINRNDARNCLLGQVRNPLLEDTVSWEYVRLGSEPASKLLCEFECRWQPRSTWLLIFAELPRLLIPEDARSLLASHCSLDRRFTAELAAVLDSMHDRFLRQAPDERPQLQLVPVGGALSRLVRRLPPFEHFDDEALSDTLEFLAHDCLTHAAITATGWAWPPEMLDDVHWILASTGMAIRHRGGSTVLDYRKRKSAATTDTDIADYLLSRFAVTRFRNDAGLIRSVFQRLIAELRG